MKRAFQSLGFILAFCVGTLVCFGQENPKPSEAKPKRPLALGLLVDNSGSLRTNFSQVIDVAKEVVQNSDSDDQIFLVRFISADAIRIVNDFTNEKSALTRSLEEMYVEGGKSAITDALYLSARHLVEKTEKPGAEGYKGALIVITDGAEESSYYRMEALLSLLREKNIRIYVVAFPQALVLQGLKVQEKAKSYLKRLVEQSGGRVYFPTNSDDKKILANTILSDIRSSN